MTPLRRSVSLSDGVGAEEAQESPPNNLSPVRRLDHGPRTHDRPRSQTPRRPRVPPAAIGAGHWESLCPDDPLRNPRRTVPCRARGGPAWRLHPRDVLFVASDVLEPHGRRIASSAVLPRLAVSARLVRATSSTCGSSPVLSSRQSWSCHRRHLCRAAAVGCGDARRSTPKVVGPLSEHHQRSPLPALAPKREPSRSQFAHSQVKEREVSMTRQLNSWGSTLSVLFFLAAATPVRAQGIATSFDQLRVLVKPGNTLAVTDAAGRETKGKLLALSASSLELSVGQTTRTFAESEVQAVSQQRHASFGTGAKWGFFIGAGLGALAGIGAAAEGYTAGESVGLAFLGAGIYGGLGAGVGVGVSGLIRGSHVVYAGRPASSTKLALSPILFDGRKGAAVSLRF